MNNEIVKVDAGEYGVDKSGAGKVDLALAPMITQRGELEKQFEIVIAAGIADDNIEHAKVLGKALQQTRTGIEKVRKSQKDVSLRYGQFIDAVAKAETIPIVQMEVNVKEIIQYHENVEKDRIAKLLVERMALVSPIDSNARHMKLEEMDDERFEAYYDERVLLNEAKKAREAEAEAIRIAEEKKIEDARIAKEEADKAAQKAKDKELSDLKKASEIAKKAEAKRVADQLAIDEENNRILAEEKAEREAANKLREEADEKLAKAEAEKQADLQKKLDEAEDEKQRLITEQAASDKKIADEKADQEKREKNHAHRKRVNNGILEAIGGKCVSDDAAKELIKLIAQGRIENVSISY